MKPQTEIDNSTIHTPQPDIPPGWRWVRLGEACEINPPRTKNFKRLPNTPTTFIPMATVNERTGNVANPEIVPYSRVSKGYTYFEENDVLFAKITPCMQNGKHIIARNLIDGIGFGTTEFHVLRSNKEALPKWIWYFIRQHYFLQEATVYFTGAVGQQRVPDSFLSDYIIPLPPIEEQRRITTKLQELMREIERARTTVEKQLEAANSLSSAYLRAVFESEESKKWERKRLGDVCEFQKGRTPQTLYEQQKKYCLPYILIESFDGTYKKFTDDDSCPKCSGEDVLLVWDGARSGLCATGLEGYIGSTVSALKAKDCISPNYLYWFVRFHYDDLNKNVRGTGIPHLEKEYVHSLQIPLPPLSEQKHIVADLKEKMAQAEKLRTSIEKQLETINALPQVILRKAFRGEL